MAEIEIKPVDASPAAPDRLLLVSDNLPEPDLLILAALPNVTVVKVLYEKWNLAQLKQAVDAYAYGRKFASVALFDHGESGELCLLKSVSGGAIDLSDVDGGDEEAAMFFKHCGSLVAEGGRIDLLACSVASGKEGLAFVKRLADISGVEVAASADKTGAGAGAEGGFDFMLEKGKVAAGSVYFYVAELREWRHTADLDDAAAILAFCFCFVVLLDALSGANGGARHRRRRHRRRRPVTTTTTTTTTVW